MHIVYDLLCNIQHIHTTHLKVHIRCVYGIWFIMQLTSIHLRMYHCIIQKERRFYMVWWESLQKIAGLHFHQTVKAGTYVKGVAWMSCEKFPCKILPHQCPSVREILVILMNFSTKYINSSNYSLWNPVMHNDIIKWKHFPCYWPFVRGTTGHWWIPLTQASDTELWCFLWSVPEQTVEQTIKTSAIWDTIVLIIKSL